MAPPARNSRTPVADNDAINGGYRQALQQLSERLDGMQSETSGLLKEISERLRKLELDNTSVLTVLQQQMAAVAQRIEEVRAAVAAEEGERRQADQANAEEVKCLSDKVPEKLRDRLEAVENVVKPLSITMKILTFIASALVLSLMGLLWAIFTGQAAIIFSK